MRLLRSYTTLLVAALLAAVSCIKEPEMSFEQIEQRSLKAWIEQHHPELKNNYQENGGYYVEVLDAGCSDSLPITGKDVWVWFDFTGRDLHGNVCETRDWLMAAQLGTYNVHTRYAPAYRFSGEDSFTNLEGTYLATYNELDINGEKFSARYGTKLRLYLPSSVVSSEGITGDGGYEGQFALDANKPMIVDMTIYGHVNNPVAYEGNRVDSFANINGGLCTEHRTIINTEDEEDEAETTSYMRRHTRTEEESTDSVDRRPLEFFDGRWHQPIDTLAQLYVNYAYTPKKMLDYNAIGVDTLMYPEENGYRNGTIYGTQSLAEIDRRINEALLKRFGEGIGYDEVLTADSVNTKNSANIWYIGRFLDGFVFDTNIDEVKEIVYGKVESAGTAISFSTVEPLENDFILAWNYAIPTLRRGQWATILTVSTYGYGINGIVGSHTSTSTSNDSYIDMLNYYNYMNYMNNYYGNSYGGMYNNGYYGYDPYYYGYTTTTEETTTTVTTSTEISAFTPLLFQVFVAK